MAPLTSLSFCKESQKMPDFEGFVPMTFFSNFAGDDCGVLHEVVRSLTVNV